MQDIIKVYQNKEEGMYFHMVQKTGNDQKVSDGPSRADIAKRLIFTSGPFCQSRSLLLLRKNVQTEFEFLIASTVRVEIHLFLLVKG